MAQLVTKDSRSAIERARFFLYKAKDCTADNRVDFEAYLEASIIFARSAMPRVKKRYGKEAEFKNWWDPLLNDPSINFFRVERNFILKEAPAKFNQIITAPLMPAGGIVGGQQVKDDEPDVIDIETITSEEPVFASELYYIDDPSIPATQTVENHLNKVEAHINSFLETLAKT